MTVAQLIGRPALRSSNPPAEFSAGAAHGRRAIRLCPAEAITASTPRAAQSDSYELVRHLDWEPAGFNELFDGDKNVPPAGVAAEPEPLALLRCIFKSAAAPRITVIVCHGL